MPALHVLYPCFESCYRPFGHVFSPTIQSFGRITFRAANARPQDNSTPTLAHFLSDTSESSVFPDSSPPAAALPARASPIFIAACLFTRGIRFFLVAWLFQKFGPTLAPIIEKRVGLFMLLFLAILVGGFALAALLH